MDTAYASVDNGFLGVKIFNITLNYMNHLFYYTECHFFGMHAKIHIVWSLTLQALSRQRAFDSMMQNMQIKQRQK
jgi:hypothetical protein